MKNYLFIMDSTIHRVFDDVVEFGYNVRKSNDNCIHWWHFINADMKIRNVNYKWRNVENTLIGDLIKDLLRDMTHLYTRHRILIFNDFINLYTHLPLDAPYISDKKIYKIAYCIGIIKADIENIRTSHYRNQTKNKIFHIYNRIIELQMDKPFTYIVEL